MLLTAGLAVLPMALAQQTPPRIGYIYPAGGRQGTTFEVVVGGQNLNGVTNIFVTGSGVRATVIEQKRTLTPKETKDLREQMEQLQDKKQATIKPTGKPGTNTTQRTTFTADDEKLLVEIRRKLAKFGRRPANPSLGEFVTLQITLAPTATTGTREIRLATERGLSNPLVFCIGQLPEFTKPEAKHEEELRYRNEPRGAVPATETSITMPAIVNGQILPGGVDRYHFPARRGQQVVVVVSARQLIPYLADAVPGWFQVTMALYDSGGHELDYADHYRFQPDPVLYCEIPKDGEYTVEVRDSLYRGREDFVYRLALGELPFITGIFPLGIQTGQTNTVTLRGGNLPVTQLTFDAKDKLPGTYPIVVRNTEWISNVMPFVVDELPDCFEKEPNNKPDSAQRVILPIVINGRIDPASDTDVFCFAGRAGQQLVAEVRARRLNSPLDSVLKLTDAAGNQLAFNDDFEDKGAGLTTHHADSYLNATLPADGTYFIFLSDAQHKGGSDYTYRLRLSAPRPGFELRVVPASVNARPGGSASVTIYALRRDGFTNEIAIALKDAPAGFRLANTSLITTQEQLKLTLNVPSKPLPEPITLNFEGRAVVQGQEVAHIAVPAEDMMQAFLYRHLVPVKEMKVAVTVPPPPRPTPKIISATPIEIPPGGTGNVRISFPANTPAGKIQFELNEAPDGITLQSFAPGRDGMELVLRSDAQKVKPGQKGRVTVRAWVEKTPAPNKQLIPIESVPAIQIEISPP
ncbi:MAG: PPC domain-containing protein [Verrucomicrobiota bacterium]